jgi:hypothetical protein
VRVGTEEEIDVALGAGAKMVCIGDVSTAQAEELLGKLPDDVVSVRGMRERRETRARGAHTRGARLRAACTRKRALGVRGERRAHAREARGDALLRGLRHST